MTLPFAERAPRGLPHLGTLTVRERDALRLDPTYPAPLAPTMR